MPASFSGEIVDIQLDNPQHAQALVHLLNLYACDPMGGGSPLDPVVRDNLISHLQKFPTYYGLLAMEEGQYLGLVNCFLGFSTFRAKPLLNIHDIAVDPAQRRRKIGQALLQSVDRLAHRLGCCAITLEVRADNPARKLYLACGYEAGDPNTDAMSFLKKPL